MVKENYIANKIAYNGLSAIMGISVYIVVLRSTREQRDDLAVKSTGFSCRGPKFGFQHPHGSVVTPLTTNHAQLQFRRVRCPPLDFLGTECMWYTDTCRESTVYIK